MLSQRRNLPWTRPLEFLPLLAVSFFRALHVPRGCHVSCDRLPCAGGARAAGISRRSALLIWTRGRLSAGHLHETHPKTLGKSPVTIADRVAMHANTSPQHDLDPASRLHHNVLLMEGAGLGYASACCGAPVAPQQKLPVNLNLEARRVLPPCEGVCHVSESGLM